MNGQIKKYWVYSVLEITTGIIIILLQTALTINFYYHWIRLGAWGSYGQFLGQIAFATVQLIRKISIGPYFLKAMAFSICFSIIQTLVWRHSVTTDINYDWPGLGGQHLIFMIYFIMSIVIFWAIFWVVRITIYNREHQ
jgi:hypothetical protein